MNKIHMVDLAGQHQPIQKEIDTAIARIMKRANFISGDEVK